MPYMTELDMRDLVHLTTEAARRITLPEATFDALAASHLIDNTVIATNCLTPAQFSQMPRESVDLALDAAELAREVAPSSVQDAAVNKTRDRATRSYKTMIWQPLTGLLSLIDGHAFNDQDLVEVSRLKAATALSAELFTHIMYDMYDTPDLNALERFFLKNAEVALERAQQIQTR
jgi:hypothetical protein